MFLSSVFAIYTSFTVYRYTTCAIPASTIAQQHTMFLSLVSCYIHRSNSPHDPVQKKKKSPHDSTHVFHLLSMKQMLWGGLFSHLCQSSAQPLMREGTGKNRSVSYSLYNYFLHNRMDHRGCRATVSYRQSSTSSVPRMRGRLLLLQVLETPSIISSGRLTCSCTALVYRLVAVPVIATGHVPRGLCAFGFMMAPSS